MITDRPLVYRIALDLGLPEIRIPRPRSVEGTHAYVSASCDIFFLEFSRESGDVEKRKKGKKRETMRFESFWFLYWRKLLASISRIGAMHEARELMETRGDV